MSRWKVDQHLLKQQQRTTRSKVSVTSYGMLVLMGSQKSPLSLSGGQCFSFEVAPKCSVRIGRFFALDGKPQITRDFSRRRFRFSTSHPDSDLKTYSPVNQVWKRISCQERKVGLRSMEYNRSQSLWSNRSTISPSPHQQQLVDNYKDIINNVRYRG